MTCICTHAAALRKELIRISFRGNDNSKHVTITANVTVMHATAPGRAAPRQKRTHVSQEITVNVMLAMEPKGRLRRAKQNCVIDKADVAVVHATATST